MGIRKKPGPFLGACYICGGPCHDENGKNGARRDSMKVGGKWAHVWHIDAYRTAARTPPST